MGDFRRAYGVFFVIVLVIGVGQSLRSSCQPDEPTTAAPSTNPFGAERNDAGNIVLAATADSSEALRFVLSVAPGARGRRFTLVNLRARAVLTLLTPEPGPEKFPGFGRCTLEAEDRDAGAAFAAAVASWLMVPVPPVGPDHPLAPVGCSYAVLGSGTDPAGKTWLVRKLFFAARHDTAEVFLRVSEDEKRAELIEKGADYRKPLVEALWAALRDGPIPRRTMATDPNLASEAPLVASLQPVPGADHVDTVTWVGDRLLAVRRAGEDSVLLLWDALDARPRDLAHVQGRVSALRPDPTGERVAMITAYPEKLGSISTGSAGTASIVEVPSAKTVVLHARGAAPRVTVLSNAVWSPDGKHLAIATHAQSPDGGAGGRVTVVYEVASGQRVDATSPELDARPDEWTAQGLRLDRSRFDLDTRELKRVHARWEPGKGAPSPLEVDAASAEVRSADGRFGVRLGDQGLLVTGPGGDRRFWSARADDQEALEALAGSAEWIGGAGLLLRGDHPVVIDLATLKVRLLLPADAPAGNPSSNGKVVLVSSDDDSLHWGKLEQ